MADDDYSYLAGLSAHPGRAGDTSNFNPAFASALAAAVRQARAAGLPITLNSGFREPGQTGSAYDAGGNSSHTYGLASDVGGLDGPNGKITNAWAQIAAANGLHNPYGVGDAKEFNHWQLPAQPLEDTPQLLQQLKDAKATGSFQNVWNAYSAGAQPIAGPLAGPAFTMPDNAPAGMRNNNPLNIKYVAGAPYAGLVGPSKNTDQGDPQMVFSSPEAGWSAAYQLLGRKYGSGMTTPAQIIAGQGGWTPGNTQSAANVAKSAGIGVNDDIGFSDPGKAAKFMRALVTQEQGGAGSAYSDAMIANAISGKWTPSTTTPAASTPGTTINTTGAAAGALPGFGTKAASDQFLGGLKQMGITPPTDQPDQQQQNRPSPIMGGPGLRNSPGIAGVEAAARQMTPNIAQQLYGQTLNSHPLAWSNQAIPAPSWMTNAGAQGAPQGIGTSLNSLASQQMAYGLSPYQLQMMMNPMMLQGGGNG